jgi:type III secretory pathway component EscV
MKRFVRGFSFIIFMVTASMALSPSQALSQEQNTENETGTTNEQKADDENQQQAQEGDQQSEASQTPPVVANQDTFVPSEEISEDLPVSFPVDI